MLCSMALVDWLIGVSASCLESDVFLVRAWVLGRSAMSSMAAADSPWKGGGFLECVWWAAVRIIGLSWPWGMNLDAVGMSMDNDWIDGEASVASVADGSTCLVAG